MSASSSSPLPSLYLALCATQQNVEEVDKQIPNASTRVPGSQIHPLPVIIPRVAMAQALAGVLGDLGSNWGNAFNPSTRKVLPLLASCDLLILTATVEGKQCGDRVPLHFTAEDSDARDPVTVQGYRVNQRHSQEPCSPGPQVSAHLSLS